MRVLLTGAGGQIGRALVASCPQNVELLALDREDLDITDAAAVAASIGSIRPELIVNAAAYTAVDKAESEPQLARAVNEDGACSLASGAAAVGARMIQLSTDFVFDGRSAVPYLADARPAPLSVYGQTKLGGETAVLEALKGKALILRTSWVYAAEGRNFLRTMLRLMREGRELRIVADQIGTPTAAHSVAEVIWRLAELGTPGGIYHWSDEGVASWYDFAVAIAEEAAERGLVEPGIRISAIGTDEYDTAARRPAFSVLDKRSTVRATGLSPRHWRQSLRKVLTEVKFE